MYRTATISAYDVLDQVFVTAIIKEYPSTPGTLPPIEYVCHTTIPSAGWDDWRRWFSEGLTALAAESNSE